MITCYFEDYTAEKITAYLKKYSEIDNLTPSCQDLGEKLSKDCVLIFEMDRVFAVFSFVSRNFCLPEIGPVGV
jgi:hypothetical protein